MGEKIFIDPAFLRKSNYSYVNYEDAELASVLCFALARNNSDLILHQQRIEHNVKSSTSNVLFTSIVDLFITLGGKGSEYKNRILDKYRKQLTSHQALLLTKSLIKNIERTDVIPELNHSLLSFGMTGKLLTSQMIDRLK
jgi:hypothetical protein